MSLSMKSLEVLFKPTQSSRVRVMRDGDCAGPLEWLCAVDAAPGLPSGPWLTWL